MVIVSVRRVRRYAFEREIRAVLHPPAVRAAIRLRDHLASKQIEAYAMAPGLTVAAAGY